jgi:hypothetical protein
VSELNPDELEFGSKFEEASRAAHG